LNSEQAHHDSVPTDATGGDRPPLSPATLYLVATPIGNLEDITLRAIRVLRECDVIAAEDTRHTGLLLKHLGIKKSMISHHAHNEARRTQEIVERLGRGERVALVTDAGSPGISDPGERVVKAVSEAGFRVEAVPGACALVAALTTSGLPTGEFHRTVVLARELTKKFEEFIRGRPDEVASRLQNRSLKGEFVVLVAPAAVPKARDLPTARPTPAGPTGGEIGPVRWEG
jgi:16S rRNA (cytidine1402-2'-O)-methyltransferase